MHGASFGTPRGVAGREDTYRRRILEPTYLARTKRRRVQLDGGEFQVDGRATRTRPVGFESYYADSENLTCPPEGKESPQFVVAQPEAAPHEEAQVERKQDVAEQRVLDTELGRHGAAKESHEEYGA